MRNLYNSTRFMVNTEGSMPGNPKECRQHAEECYQMAEQAKDSATAKIWSDMGKQWAMLARDAESAETLLLTLQDIDLDWAREGWKEEDKHG
jgi:hypothetical protein